MGIYIIVLEWEEGKIPETSALEGLLDSNFRWLKLTETSYLIKSVNTTIEIRNYINLKLTNIRRLFVGEMKTSAAWKNMTTGSEAIKNLYEDE